MQINQISINEEFPINKWINYLNNAAYCPVPRKVLQKNASYLQEYSEMGPDSGFVKLDEYVEEARYAASALINCNPEEIVFTESITHGINLIAEGYKFSQKGNIILRESSKDHVANFLPWLKRSKENNVKIKVTGSNDEGDIDLDRLEIYMRNNPSGILSVSHALYNIGTILDVETIAEIAHKHNFRIFVDAGQTVGCLPVDVKKLNCDFMAFSGYKWLCSPPGIGVLYIKKEIQKEVNYFGMDVRSLESEKEGVRVILKFTDKDYSLKDGPKRFEAGFRNYTGAVGLLEAIRFITNYGIENVRSRNILLTSRARQSLSDVTGIEFYGPEEGNRRTSIISFNIRNVKPSELVAYLLEKNCVMAAREIGSLGIVRISPHYYNTEEQIDQCISFIKEFINEKE